MLTGRHDEEEAGDGMEKRDLVPKLEELVPTWGLLFPEFRT
jgi:hypothetical protein